MNKDDCDKIQWAQSRPWASNEDFNNYCDELAQYGSATCIHGADGLTRHSPRPEWTPIAVDE